VSESGKISLPLIGQIQAEGLTEAQLEQAITAAYRESADQSRMAQVSGAGGGGAVAHVSILDRCKQPGQLAQSRANDFDCWEPRGFRRSDS